MSTQWEKTYRSIWLAQFTSILGFAFALPFAPYYIQELGVTDPTEVKLWVALFAAATPLSLAIFSPLWGAASDRFGHRLMMLRANFSAVGVLALMGTVSSVEALIALRLLQGALTGTLTASQIMVAAHAPDDRSGRALGTLTAAVFSGATCGAALGGLFSDWFGYRPAFFMAAGFLLLSAILILFGTRSLPDQPLPPGNAPAEAVNPVPASTARAAFRLALPLLLLTMVISFVRQFDMAMLPLLVQEIHGQIKGVSVRTGALLAVSSVAGMLAGVYLGRLADRIHPSRLSVVGALLAALTMLPQALATAVWVLFPARFAMIFCTGGLETVTQIWLAKITPQKHKGLIFGWASTTRSIGWGIAPLAGGAVAAVYDIRAVFFASAALFLMLIPLIWFTRKRIAE